MVKKYLLNPRLQALHQSCHDFSPHVTNPVVSKMLWKYTTLAVPFRCSDSWRESMVAERFSTILELENHNSTVTWLSRQLHPASSLFFSYSLTRSGSSLGLLGSLNTVVGLAFPTSFSHLDHVSSGKRGNGNLNQDEPDEDDDEFEKDEEEGENEEDEEEEFPEKPDEEQDEFEVEEDEFNGSGDGTGLDEEVEQDEESEQDDFDEEFEEDEGNEDLEEEDEDYELDDDEYDDDEDEFDPDVN